MNPNGLPQKTPVFPWHRLCSLDVVFWEHSWLTYVFSEEVHWDSSETYLLLSNAISEESELKTMSGFPRNPIELPQKWRLQNQSMCHTVFRWICIVTTMFSDEFVSWQPCFPMNLLLWQPCFPMNLFRNNQVFWWICLVTTILMKLYRHNNVFRWFVVTRKRWLLRTFCNWGFLL